jgi:hypothetical protein
MGDKMQKKRKEILCWNRKLIEDLPLPSAVLRRELRCG